MKIMVVEDEADIRELIAFTLTSKFSVEVVEKENGKQALDYIDKSKDIDLIVTDLNMPVMNGIQFIEGLEKRGLKTPVLVCSSKSSDFPELKKKKIVAAFIDKPEIMSPLIQNVKKFIGESQPEYIPIKVKTLLKSGVLVMDVYVKIGEKKFVKILKSGELFNFPDAERYVLKNVDVLYLLRNDLDSFLLKLSNEVESMHSTKNDMSYDEAFNLSTNALRLIRDISMQLGISEKVQDLAKKSAALSVKKIKSYPDLAVVFEKMSTMDPTNYMVDHSVVTSSVACGIASLLGWESDMTFYKLSLAGFLHDLTLKDALLAKVADLDDVLTGDLLLKYSPVEVDEYRKHAENAADIVSKFSDLPQDIVHIIRQHHERPDGNGFPNRISYKEISPIAAVFIIAEDLVNFLMESKSQTVSDFVEIKKTAYEYGFFTSAMYALGAAVAAAK